MYYKIKYKCRRCGETFNSGLITGSIDTVYKGLVNTLEKNIVFNNTGISISMFYVHKCNDGCMGVGDLVGCDKEESGD